ncbi:MAG: hypothetical protein WCO18_00685 [bacterium]
MKTFQKLRAGFSIRWIRFLVWMLSKIIESEKTKPKIAIMVHGLKGRPIHVMIEKTLLDTLKVFDPKSIFEVLHPKSWHSDVNFDGTLFILKIAADMEWGETHLSLCRRAVGSSEDKVLFHCEIELKHLERDMQKIFRQIVTDVALELANKPT